MNLFIKKFEAELAGHTRIINSPEDSIDLSEIHSNGIAHVDEDDLDSVRKMDVLKEKYQDRPCAE